LVAVRDPKRAGNDRLKERPAAKMADKKIVHDVLHELTIDSIAARAVLRWSDSRFLRASACDSLMRS
jgi:hypothetical protein